MDETKKVYCSYLLRIWIEPSDGDQWRFSLEETRTGKRVGFSSLENLTFYLKMITENEENCILDR